jgi:magnesium transporter
MKKEVKMSESRFYHIDVSGKLARVSTLEEVLLLSKTGGFIWLSYCEPTLDEISKLEKPLGLHPLSIEDCVDDIQIPKIDDFPGNTFILFNAFHYSQTALAIEEVNLFIGKNFLVTIIRHVLFEKKLIESVEQIAANNVEKIKQGPAFLMHIFLDLIVDKKFETIEAMEDELDKAEDTMLSKPADFNLGDLQYLRRDLLSLRKSLFHEREIFVKICRKDSPFIPENAILDFRDIYDHLANFFELTETFREIVTSLMEMHLSLLNNQMAKAANQTNSIVRRLTLITTIFMPLTLLAGIGGMSEWSMMTNPENWKISYPLFILGMILIGAANYFFLKRLEKKDRENEIK